jgi:hypothetical protein
VSGGHSKSELAEIVLHHLGKAPIIFDEQDAAGHGFILHYRRDGLSGDPTLTARSRTEVAGTSPRELSSEDFLQRKPIRLSTVHPSRNWIFRFAKGRQRRQLRQISRRR